MNTRNRVILSLFIVSLFLLTFIPEEATAIPYRIKGYLRDVDGNPIPDGNISITGETYDIGIQDFSETTIWLMTDNTGYYGIALAYNEPGGFDTGATVIISYNPSNGDDGVSESVTFDGLQSWANLTYEKNANLIDLLFSPIGLISIVIIVSTCFIGYYMYRSSKEEEGETPESKRSNGRRRR